MHHTIPKKRKGGNLISAGDIILISKRPFNDKLADVLYKYKDTEKYLSDLVNAHLKDKEEIEEPKNGRLIPYNN